MRSKHWPPRWSLSHGRIYYQVPADQRERWDGKTWFPLGATEGEAWATWYARLHAPADARTVGDAIDRYGNEIVPTLKPATRRQYLDALARLRRVFGAMSPAAVKPAHVYAYMDLRPRIVANRERAVLSTVMSYAVRWGIVDTNPVREVRRNTETARERAVEPPEVAAFLMHANPMLRAYVALKLSTGLRQGQLLALRLSDWDGAVLRASATKGGRATAYRGEGLQDAVGAVLALRRGRALRGLTLFATRDGQQYTSDGFRSIWQRAMRKHVAAGGERFTEHDLRAVVATRAGSAEHARDLLGHSTSQVTQRVYQRGAREVAILPYQKPSDAKASTPYDRTRKARRAKESPPDQGDA